jgi:hypothetical protein
MTTDKRAVKALLPYLDSIDTFAEPCVGEGHLVRQIEAEGLHCLLASDINQGIDALTLTFKDIDAIITNPPWTRELLHPMIAHFCTQAPTWLLFDSDWAYTIQAEPYLFVCSDIVPTPRLKWLAHTKWTALDNTSWYRFDAKHTGPTIFHGRR